MLNNIDSYRVINGHETFSQAYQDLFVRYLTEFKRNGFYVEIGASDPIESSNSYILERDYCWDGISIEIDNTLCKKFNDFRSNICLNADATTYNYLSYFENNHLPKEIDYLSLDIDPPIATLNTLKKIPFSEYRFAIITFEHDFYLSGSGVMNESRDFLKSHGYKIIVSNVLCTGRDFEDWYVHPKLIQEKKYKSFQNSHIECAKIFGS